MGVVLCVNPREAQGAEEYSFVKMWPNLPESWYFDFPCGVAVDGLGNVYVVECGVGFGNARVQKFSSEGVLIAKWGREGRGDGEFSGPGGVAVDGSGNVYVADSQNNRIQKFRRCFGTKAVRSVGTLPTIEWDTEPGKSYTVWVAGPTSTGFDWMSVPGTVAGSDTGISSWTDDGQHALGSPAAAVLRFYRIELLP
jgi:DNA-binding beta-propeller fold protein YncE